MKKTKAIFLDRDGVINKMYYHRQTGIIDTPLTPTQVSFTPGIFSFLRLAKKMGFLLILVSNQPGVGIKKLSRQNFLGIKKKINSTLKTKNITFDAEYYCMHHPFALLKKYKKTCTCRKPNTQLLEKAIQSFHIDTTKSWLIGDGVFDILMGKKIGVRTILLANIYETEYLRIIAELLKNEKPDFLVKNLEKAAIILKEQSKQ